MQTKQVQEVLRSDEPHWVGDGFPVSTLFSMREFGQRLSPFLMLDYAAPTEFPPSEKPRGVDTHPHKGFETVTIVYQGALEHRDSTGSSGTIGPGDVQWMTAASGILHEEKHERNWSRRGGIFQVAQLWVNLPARFKASPPGYQTLLRDDVPVVELPDGKGRVRVIAGDFNGTRGAARTFTPINVFDVRLRAGGELSLDLPAGHHAAAAVLEGEVVFNGSQPVAQVAMVLFDAGGERITVRAQKDAMLLVLSGEPIHEPIVAHGPFVMNTQDEIRQAIQEVQSGRMGRLPAST